MPLMSAVQMNSSARVQDNLQTVARHLEKAALQGTKLVVLPEMFACMAPKTDILNIQELFGRGPIQAELCRLAKQFELWIIAGTMAIASDSPDRYYASCLVINHHGDILGRYNKMHLYDISLTAKEQYLESETTLPGDDVVVVKTPFGHIGLAVCYDVRFPELFRQLVLQGAEIIALPAAFVKTTGQYHWEVLVRARAIENSCYMIAPNQFGHHDNGYHTYGHSLIVDPWGNILAQAEQDSTQLVTADVDVARTNEVRNQTPFIKHRRLL